MSKTNFIKLSLSNTFLFKNRCAFCLSGPVKYMYKMAASSFKDYKTGLFINWWITSNIEKMSSDFYLTAMPVNLNKNTYLSHAVDYKGFNPRFHKNSKYHNYDDNSIIVDCLQCSCGKTNWSFNETSSKNKPEIKQRRAKNTYPKKYNY